MLGCHEFCGYYDWTFHHVRERHGQLTVWAHGQVVATLAKRAQSGTHVPHPDQFRTVAPAAATVPAAMPLGHLIPCPPLVRRPLAEYDRLYGARGGG